MFHGEGVVHYAVLDTGGCLWARSTGGCSMCGYVHDSCMRGVSGEEIDQQVDGILARMPKSQGPFALKIFTSGSFLDEREIDRASREQILCRLSELPGLAELTIETRPEFVTGEAVRETREMLPNAVLEVAIGLESSSDWVRQSCIGKGFAFEDFRSASQDISGAGARCKAYILLKPPFLSEHDAAYDSIQTVADCAPLVDSVSVNACNVQRGTLVEEMQRNGSYRPPWIWTVLEVLRKAREMLPEDKALICDTVAFGTIRGPHNCRRCDRKLTRMVERFSLTQDPSVLAGVDCPCRGEWAADYYYGF